VESSTGRGGFGGVPWRVEVDESQRGALLDIRNTLLDI
jgi:hypothetical protein